MALPFPLPLLLAALTVATAAGFLLLLRRGDGVQLPGGRGIATSGCGDGEGDLDGACLEGPATELPWVTQERVGVELILRLLNSEVSLDGLARWLGPAGGEAIRQLTSWQGEKLGGGRGNTVSWLIQAVMCLSECRLSVKLVSSG